MSDVHVVQAGECFTSLAARYGFATPEPLLAANRTLLQHRHPNMLEPGDRVTIPPRRQEAVVAAPGEHTFVTGLPRAHVRLRLEDAQRQPLAGARYRLVVGGKPGPIKTTADGRVDEAIAAEATEATLELIDARGEAAIALRLRIGHLRPADSEDGCRQRLDNLGLHAGDDRDRYARAVRRFRAYWRWRHPDADVTAEPPFALVKEAHGG